MTWRLPARRWRRHPELAPGRRLPEPVRKWWTSRLGSLRCQTGDDLEDDVGDLLCLDSLESFERFEEPWANEEVGERAVPLLAGKGACGPLGEDEVPEPLLGVGELGAVSSRALGLVVLVAFRSRARVDFRSFSALFARRSAWSSRNRSCSRSSVPARSWV